MKINYDYIKENYSLGIKEKEILVVNDFITKAEQKEVLNLIAKTKEEDWKHLYINSIIDQVKNTYGTEDYEKLIEENIISINPNNIDKTIKIPIEKLSEKWFEKLTHFFIAEKAIINQAQTFTTITRRYAGTMFDYHVDSSGFDGKADQNVFYTCIIYLNDDYNGGELDFPNQKIFFKPPARSLVIFNSGPDYLHGVKQVKEGPTRYVSTCFMRE